jgi:prophage endopeptidase
MIPIPPALAAEVGSSGFKVAIFVLTMIASAMGGAYLMADHKDAVINQMEANQAKSEAAVVAAGAKRLRDAQARGDTLTNQLAQAEQVREKTAQEHAREIKNLTTGRPCLNAGVVRVLNGTGQGIVTPAVPAPTGGAVAEDGAFATDTDVAGWADNARRQYETCRARLGALIDFEGSEQ